MTLTTVQYCSPGGRGAVNGVLRLYQGGERSRSCPTDRIEDQVRGGGPQAQGDDGGEEAELSRRDSSRTAQCGLGEHHRHPRATPPQGMTTQWGWGAAPSPPAPAPAVATNSSRR